MKLIIPSMSINMDIYVIYRLNFNYLQINTLQIYETGLRKLVAIVTVCIWFPCYKEIVTWNEEA
jgi:hypothetical protein